MWFKLELPFFFLRSSWLCGPRRAREVLFAGLEQDSCQCSHQWRFSCSGLNEPWKESHNKTDGFPFEGMSQMLRVTLDRWCCCWTVITAIVCINAYYYNSIVYVIAVFCSIIALTSTNVLWGLTAPFFCGSMKKYKLHSVLYIVAWTHKNNQASILTVTFGFLLQGSSSGLTGMPLSPASRLHLWVEEVDTLCSKIWKSVPGLMDWLWIIWKRGLFGQMHGIPLELPCCVQKYSHLS